MAAVDEAMVVGGQWFEFYLEHFLLTFVLKCVTHQDRAPEPFELKGVTRKCTININKKKIAVGAENAITHTIRLDTMDSVVQPVSKHITEPSRSTLRQKQGLGPTRAPRGESGNAKNCCCR